MNTPRDYFPQSVNILAFDTSTDEASVALWASGKMHSLSLPLGDGLHSQAACLVPALQELLNKENLTFQDLHVIATPVGPGSFTGIRIGLATAQGLMLATSAKSFAPTTFETVAFNAWRSSSDQPCLVSLTTKRGSFYTQTFEAPCVPSGQASIQTEQEIQDFLKAHPNIRRISQYPALNAENLIRLYFYKLSIQQEIQNILKPHYVHNPEFVKQPLCSL